MVHFDDRGASICFSKFPMRFFKKIFEDSVLTSKIPTRFGVLERFSAAAERKLQIAQIVRSQLNGGSRLAELKEVPASR